MCAIFGIIGRSNVELLKKCPNASYIVDLIQNFFTNKKFKLSFGMNRLSVIDKRRVIKIMFSRQTSFDSF